MHGAGWRRAQAPVPCMQEVARLQGSYDVQIADIQEVIEQRGGSARA